MLRTPIKPNKISNVSAVLFTRNKEAPGLIDVLLHLPPQIEIYQKSEVIVSKVLLILGIGELDRDTWQSLCDNCSRLKSIEVLKGDHSSNIWEERENLVQIDFLFCQALNEKNSHKTGDKHLVYYISCTARLVFSVCIFAIYLGDFFPLIASLCWDKNELAKR